MTGRATALAAVAVRGLAALALVVAGACNRGSSAAPSPKAEPADVGDAHRVVSISPSTTEALFAIGAGDRVVGRSRFCDWPPEAGRLPIVGGFAGVDPEAVLGLEPDLVAGAPGPAAAHLIDPLAARGIATWFPATDSLASIDAMVIGLGDRTGHGEDARRIVAQVDAREHAVDIAVGSEPAPRVLMVIGLDPTVAAGPKSFAGELIVRARAVNVLTEGGPWQTVGFEGLVDLAPDVVVDASAGESGGVSRITAQSPGWSKLPAVRRGDVVPIADERVFRPGPRIAEGLAVLARALHPHAPVPSW